MTGQRVATAAGMKRANAILALKASGAETANTTGSAFDTGECNTLYVQVDVTAASGTTPTLTVVVEGSNDNSNYFVLATIGSNGGAVGAVGTAPANFTTTGTARCAVPAAQWVRYRSVITGTTPSFTYSVTGELN